MYEKYFNIKLINDNKAMNFIVFLFFLAFLLLGLSIFRDYSLSLDEPIDRWTGMTSLKYVLEYFHLNSYLPHLHTDPCCTLLPLHQWIDRDYGVVFQLPASILEHVLKIRDQRHIFYLRHLLTFLVFFSGAIAMYLMSFKRFNSWKIGLLTCVFYILSPRQFAESFYNSKDIVFMALLAIAMYSSILFIEKPSFKLAVITAFTTALAVDTRIVGVVLPVIMIGFIVFKMIKKELSVKTTLAYLLVFIVCLWGFIIAMWPYLWVSPVENFIQAFRNMSKFRWPGVEELYNGHYELGSNLPWHYVFRWIAITTPMLYVLTFLIAVVAIIPKVFKSKLKLWSNRLEMQDIFFLTIFIAPIITVIVFNSTLYNSWRQLYFVYPAFLLLATGGAVLVYTKLKALRINHLILKLAFLLPLLNIGVWMIKAHPLQNVYFSVLAGKNIENRWPIDYWSLSNKQALLKILELDKRPIITISPINLSTARLANVMLTKDKQKRFEFFNYGEKQTDYLFDTYYNFNRKDIRKLPPNYYKFYDIKVNGLAVLTIYKLKK